MARARNCWSHGKKVALIWLLSAFLFFLGFRMAIRNSSQNFPLTDSDSPISNWERRSKLYDKMARDLEENGAVFLQGGQTSQSLTLSDIFAIKDGVVTPILKAADPPVRANVLYFSSEVSVPISQAAKATFLPYFDNAIWFQNSSLYHSSMFHASHHIAPVPATEEEIEAEADAVKAVADVLCPLKVILDRVILMSSGVLLGCWQVISGSDPITIRAKLRNALPHAPEKQLYDPAVFYTSFARLIGHPKISFEEGQEHSDELQFFHELVSRLNNQLRGYEAVVSELWYVEEFDKLALALDGRIKARKFHLGCSET